MVEPSGAAMVRELFDLYLQHRSLIEVCRVVNDRGWTTKTTTYKNGRYKAGVAWNKARLYDILVNVVYIGKVAHKGQEYPGEQDAIVDERVFKKVQAILQHNSQNGGADTKNRHGALLRELLKCGHCGAAMSHTYAKKGNRLYRYYMCNTRMKRGADACPTPSLPAQEIEDFVVNEIRKVARDPELVKAVYEEACSQQKEHVEHLEAEKKRLQRQLQTKAEEAKRPVSAIGGKGKPFSAITGRLAEIEGSVAQTEDRISEIDRDMTVVVNGLSANDVAEKLVEFEGVWEVMNPAEQIALVQSIVDTVDCNGSGDVALRLKLSQVATDPTCQ